MFREQREQPKEVLGVWTVPCQIFVELVVSFDFGEVEWCVVQGGALVVICRVSVIVLGGR